ALGIASIKNSSGAFVQPNAANVTAALAEVQIPPDLKIKPNYKPTAAAAYPISTPTFALAFAKQKDPAKGKLLKDFLSYAVGSGLLILGIIVAIAVFLVWKAIPAFRVAGLHFLTEKTWFPDATPAKFGVAALAFGTVLSSIIALVLVVPVAIGAALTLTELAP